MTVSPDFSRFQSQLLDRGISAHALEQLRSFSKTLHADRKRAVQLPAIADPLIFIETGSLKLVAPDANGGEQILSFHFAGDIVCFPRKFSSSFKLVALRQADLLVMSQAQIMTLACKQPALIEMICENTCLALSDCREHLLAIGRRGAMERVACFLIHFGSVRQVASNDGAVLNLPMTRKEIADCLGLTVETVSRQFSKLRELGLIDTPSRNRVVIADLPRIEQLTGRS